LPIYQQIRLHPELFQQKYISSNKELCNQKIHKQSKQYIEISNYHSVTKQEILVLLLHKEPNSWSKLKDKNKSYNLVIIPDYNDDSIFSLYFNTITLDSFKNFLRNIS
ncbi:MAG: hypothetical protein ACYCST_21905, partial [Acidimicrobiales bacterium]